MTTHLIQYIADPTPANVDGSSLQVPVPTDAFGATEVRTLRHGDLIGVPFEPDRLGVAQLVAGGDIRLVATQPGDEIRVVGAGVPFQHGRVAYVDNDGRTHAPTPAT